MFAALLLFAFGQAPVALPPEVSCCRILVDIEFLLDLDASSRAMKALTLDTKAPEYSDALAKRLAQAKQDAAKLQDSAGKLLDGQKRALKAEFARIPERAYREHFLDKVHTVMLNSEPHYAALKPLYDELEKSIEPRAQAAK